MSGRTTLNRLDPFILANPLSDGAFDAKHLRPFSRQFDAGDIGDCTSITCPVTNP
jgi:hypothetical protein